jgi:hypothetical protein
MMIAGRRRQPKYQKEVIVWACLVLIGATVWGAATADEGEELRLQVRRLVRQLDDDQLVLRQAAEQRLIDLGSPILELLPLPGRGTSAEVQIRLERIRKTLEATASEAAAKPSRVTLRGSLPLSEALAALQQQTGNRIIDFRRRFGQQSVDPRLSLELDDTPFWPALDAMLDQAALTLYNFSGESGALAVVARNPDEQRRAAGAVYRGLFRIEVLRVQATRDLRNPANDSLRLTLELAWEPRVSPILLRIPLADMRAADEAGRPLALGAPRASLEVPVENTLPAAEVQVPLALPERRAGKIATLQGQLSALLPGRVETFEFGQLGQAQNVEQSRAGVTVILDQVRRNVDVDEVRLRVRFDQAREALESHRNWIYKNEAYFLDPDGQRFEHAGLQAFRQAANEVGVAYLSDRPGGLADCTFVYKTPTLLLQVPVEFELCDIPLP